jgi:hypothetical protein
MLSMTEVAQRMGIGPTGVRDLVRSGQLLTVVGDDGRRVVPAAQLDGDVLVKHLVPVLTLLRDAGYSDDEALRWLTTPDDTLPGRRCRHSTRTAPPRSSGGPRRSASDPPSDA